MPTSSDLDYLALMCKPTIYLPTHIRALGQHGQFMHMSLHPPRCTRECYFLVYKNSMKIDRWVKMIVNKKLTKHMCKNMLIDWKWVHINIGMKVWKKSTYVLWCATLSPSENLRGTRGHTGQNGLYKKYYWVYALTGAQRWVRHSLLLRPLGRIELRSG